VDGDRANFCTIIYNLIGGGGRRQSLRYKDFAEKKKGKS